MNLLKNQITLLETKRDSGMATEKDLKKLEKLYEKQGKKKGRENLKIKY